MENRCLMQSTFICGPSRSYMGKYLSCEKTQRPQLTSELSLVRGFFGMQRCWLSRVWMDAGFQCLGTKLAMLGFIIIWELCDHVSVRLHLKWQTMRKSSAYRKKKKKRDLIRNASSGEILGFFHLTQYGQGKCQEHSTRSCRLWRCSWISSELWTIKTSKLVPKWIFLN